MVVVVAVAAGEATREFDDPDVARQTLWQGC